MKQAAIGFGAGVALAILLPITGSSGCPAGEFDCEDRVFSIVGIEYPLWMAEPPAVLAIVTLVFIGVVVAFRRIRP